MSSEVVSSAADDPKVEFAANDDAVVRERPTDNALKRRIGRAVLLQRNGGAPVSDHHETHVGSSGVVAQTPAEASNGPIWTDTDPEDERDENRLVIWDDDEWEDWS